MSAPIRKVCGVDFPITLRGREDFIGKESEVIRRRLLILCIYAGMDNI